MGFTHLSPLVTEVAAVTQEYLSTNLEKIGDSGFPRSVTRTGVPNERPRIFHMVVQSCETGVEQNRELSGTKIYCRSGHCTKDPLRNIGGSGILNESPTAHHVEGIPIQCLKRAVLPPTTTSC